MRTWTIWLPSSSAAIHRFQARLRSSPFFAATVSVAISYGCASVRHGGSDSRRNGSDNVPRQPSPSGQNNFPNNANGNVQRGVAIVPAPSTAPPRPGNSTNAPDALDIARGEVEAVTLVGCPSLTSIGEFQEAAQSYDGKTPPVSKECVALKRQLEVETSVKTRDNPDTLVPQPGVNLCRRDPLGAVWGVYVRARPAPPGTYSGTWRLVRRDRLGVLANSPQQSYQGLAQDMGGRNLPPECLGFFDFNNDGRPEAIVVNREGISNVDREKRVRIWTVGSAQALQPYPKDSSPISFGVADFDGDGRPDLSINPYAASPREPTTPIGWYPRHSNLDWSLVANSRTDGTFSLDSETGRRAALRLCPSTPDPSLPRSPSHWPRYLHCAKLWGRPGSELEEKIGVACSTPTDTETENACQNGREFFRAVARARLPFEL